MGTRGPQKTPTAILKLRSSHRADERPDEPVVDSVIPDAPDWMPAACLSRWKKLTGEMHLIGMLGELDADHLAQYCVLWMQYEQALKELDAYGNLDNDPVKGMRIHPAFTVCMTLSTQVKQMGREFGCTPSARASFGGYMGVKDQKKEGLGKFKTG